MREEQIRRIVREECADIIRSSQIKESDIIVKNETIHSKEIAEAGITCLTPVKRIGNLLVCIAKKGFRTIKIFVLVLGVWSSVQFGSELLFEKSLPDAINLARLVREEGENLLQTKTADFGDEPERFILVSSLWETYSPAQYTAMAHDYLAGTRPVEELHFADSDFIPCSTVPVEFADSSSFAPDDFTASST